MRKSRELKIETLLLIKSGIVWCYSRNSTLVIICFLKSIFYSILYYLKIYRFKYGFNYCAFRGQFLGVQTQWRKRFQNNCYVELLRTAALLLKRFETYYVVLLNFFSKYHLQLSAELRLQDQSVKQISAGLKPNGPLLLTNLGEFIMSDF